MIGQKIWNTHPELAKNLESKSCRLFLRIANPESSNDASYANWVLKNYSSPLFIIRPLNFPFSRQKYNNIFWNLFKNLYLTYITNLYFLGISWSSFKSWCFKSRKFNKRPRCSSTGGKGICFRFFRFSYYLLNWIFKENIEK